MTAATQVQPLITQWLGQKPKSPLTVIDLPESQDLPWQQGPLLVTGIASQPADSYTSMMADALAHAYFQSSRQWLSEGVPNFLETLWIEHTADRNRALEQLESQRSALALAEPATPGDAPGEDLLHASDPVYYRTKATYVLWMLRDIAGEKELAAALQAYSPADDTTPGYFQKLVERASGKDLQWFFDNWVYNDRGLPDLSIAAFHSSSTSHQGLYLAAIDIMNDGFAETEVPVTVRSHDNTLTERVLLPGKTKTVHRMLVQGQPEEVIVNDGTTPEVQSNIHQRNITEQ
jgi:aminopeptidase N